MNILGFEFRKIPEAASIVPQKNDDGALEQYTGSGAAYYSHAFDINGRLTDDVSRINKYRAISQVAEIDGAIEEITTEAIVVEEEKLPVEVNVVAGDDELPVQIKEAITEEFKNILALMEFNTEGHDLFRQWYVDGRLYGQLLVDETDLSQGIKAIRFIDPRKIKKVREIQREKNSAGVDIVVDTKEYFAFNDSGINTASASVRISPDNIIYAPSGLVDEVGDTIGYLSKAVKPSNMLRYMEDAVLIYTLSRAPERRVFYIDVADMPKQKADQYVKDVMTKYKNKIVYNQQTGELSDDRVHQCLTMDTKVPLLDGRTLTLDEISKEYKDNELWAYSCDPVTGKFAPGKITWAGVSRPNAEIIRLTLDNGKTIDCTHDHRFPVWGKDLVEAKDLVVGDSMIPLYRKMEKIGSDNNEYEAIWKNDTKEWSFTHREVSNWKDSVGMSNEFLFSEEYATKQELFKTKEKQDQHKQMYATAYSQSMYDAVVSCVKTGMTKADVVQFMNASSDMVAEFNELNQAKCVSSKQKSFDGFTKYDVVRIVKQFADTTYKELVEQLKYRNHKIAKIEYLTERQDTGCLTIDGNEEFHNYHTFALDAGIYTKNSLLEDFWLPRRGNGRSTEITTLPGSTIMTQMDNVNYFLNKLYGSLNIPLSRMKQEAGFNLGRSSEITRDEIKFNKFVSRLRRKFSEIFYQALRVQLVLKGVIAPEDWQFVKSKISFDFLRDNYFSELKDNEIMTGRIQMAELVQPYVDKYYSHLYVRTQILRQSEEECEEMDKQRAIEMKEHPEWFIPPGMEMGGDPTQQGQ